VRGEGIYQQSEKGHPTSHSLEFASFHDGYKDFCWPVSQMFGTQVAKTLLPVRQLFSNMTGIQLLYHLIPGRLAMVENRYYLKNQWKENWGNPVGGKFIYDWEIHKGTLEKKLILR
jgi:hypothetical protein